jgi:hypothetical protein
MMPLRSRSDPSTDHQTRHQSKASTLVDDLEAAFIEFSGTVLFLLIAFGGAQGVSYASQSGTESPIEKNMYVASEFMPDYRLTNHMAGISRLCLAFRSLYQLGCFSERRADCSTPTYPSHFFSLV